MTLDDLIVLIKASPQQKHFIHFTDTRNLPLISKHGLLSSRQLKELNIQVPAPGGNQWSIDADRLSGMDAYVHLCFKTGHPMVAVARSQGRIKDLEYIGVRPEIIKVPGAMITLDVANKSGVSPGSAPALVDKLDLEVLYSRTNWNDPAIHARLKVAEKCELLIPDVVPLDYLIK